MEEIKKQENTNFSETKSTDEIESNVSNSSVQDTKAKNKAERIKKIINSMRKEIEDKNSKIKEYEDSIKRIAADFENYRKRVQKEKIELTRFAVKDIVLDLLPIVDNFERAIESIEKVKVEDDIRHIFDGIRIVYKEIINILNKHGVSRVDTEGKVFDPNISEAIEIEELEAHDGIEKDVVLKEYVKPYVMYNKVIRSGKVKVGKKRKKSDSETSAESNLASEYNKNFSEINKDFVEGGGQDQDNL